MNNAWQIGNEWKGVQRRVTNRRGARVVPTRNKWAFGRLFEEANFGLSHLAGLLLENAVERDGRGGAPHSPRGIWSRFHLLLVAGFVGAVAFAGCSKSETAPPPGASTNSAHKAVASAASQTPSDPVIPPGPPPPLDPVDMTRLQNAFASASPGLKVSVDETMGFVRGRDFAGALADFQRLSGNPKLTPEQRQAVNEVIVKLKELASRR